MAAEEGGDAAPGAADRPAYHVAPASGWVNDPNGPIMYKGRYHLFYQHLPEGCEWAFGLVWGHAVSADLVHWEHLPHAVEPTAASLDADGCFSGCAALDTDGTPVLLYTGVRLRTNPGAHAPPPPECDLHLPFIESQLFAVPSDPDDPHLAGWVKGGGPLLGLPPPGMNLTGWRDPYVVERPCEANGHEWVVLMGSGIKDVGGATIVYCVRQLREPSSWRFDGLLCAGEGDTAQPAAPGGAHLGSSGHQRLAAGGRCSRRDSRLAQAGGAADGPEQPQQGEQQEQEQQKQRSSPGGGAAAGGGKAAASAGPLALVNPAGQLPPGYDAAAAPPGSWDERFTHFYSISPDACTNPTIYWLGRYAGRRFDLDAARGPLRLDLGDVLYAPNLMRDDAGRLLLWGWLQERRTVGSYDYAGCMSVPRLLHLDGDRLHQSPAPELLQLRRGEAWCACGSTLSPDASLPLPGLVRGGRLDIEVVFAQRTASTVGVLLRSWHQGGEGGAAVLFNWGSGLLEVVFEALDPCSLAFSLTAPAARRIGGAIAQRPGQPLALRLLLDGSCLEVFTGTGEVLSTRVYRGSPAPGHAGPGVEFVALDGDALLERAAAYEMASIWPATSPDKQADHLAAELVAELQLQQSAPAAAASAGGGAALGAPDVGAAEGGNEFGAEEEMTADLWGLV
ncbi:BFRUCT3 [Scenedesmus sp. PABB004]|nr:BFRUCT3 [Scenedesmus sp. PABB004]